MQKKWIIASIAAAVLLSASVLLLFWGREKTVPAVNPEISEPAETPQNFSFQEPYVSEQNKAAETEESVPLALPNNKVREEGQFPRPAQEEIQKCLGASATTMPEFYRIVKARAGKSTHDILNWKNIHFESDRKHFRLRLSVEPGPDNRPILQLNLFEVDPEGLPTPIAIPDEHRFRPTPELIASYLRNKRIETTQESHTIALESGGEIRVEMENGLPKSVEWENQNLHVACTSRFEPTCKCLALRAP